MSDRDLDFFAKKMTNPKSSTFRTLKTIIKSTGMPVGSDKEFARAIEDIIDEERKRRSKNKK